MEDSNNMKIKDYFKEAENVIENNLKIFLPCMLITILFGVGAIVLIANSIMQGDDLTVAYISMILFSFTFYLLEIFMLIKVNTGISFIEDKKVKGNILGKIGRLILAYIMFALVVNILSGILVAIIEMITLISQELAVLALVILIIPSIVMTIFMLIIRISLIFEIIVKNAKVIDSFKSVYKNLMKSKNKTLSKMLVGTGVGALALMFIASISTLSINAGQSYIMIVVALALLVAVMVYFLMYYFIVYMSSEV